MRLAPVPAGHSLDAWSDATNRTSSTTRLVNTRARHGSIPIRCCLVSPLLVISALGKAAGGIVATLILGVISLIGAAVMSQYFASPDYVDQQVTYKTEELKTELIIEDDELEKALIEFKQSTQAAIQSSNNV